MESFSFTPNILCIPFCRFTKDSLWVLGHSLGGVVTSLFAESWTGDLPISVHSIAAPLTGMKRFKDNHCIGTEKETYTVRDQINYTQWKTIKEQDGAFKRLEFDPQNVLIKGGKVITLPAMSVSYTHLTLPTICSV